MMKVHFLIVTWSSGTFLLWCHRLWARVGLALWDSEHCDHYQIFSIRTILLDLAWDLTLKQILMFSLSVLIYQWNTVWLNVEPSFRRNDRETEYFVWDSGLMDSASLVTSVQQWGQETLSRHRRTIVNTQTPQLETAIKTRVQQR